MLASWSCICRVESPPPHPELQKQLSFPTEKEQPLSIPPRSAIVQVKPRRTTSLINALTLDILNTETPPPDANLERVSYLKRELDIPSKSKTFLKIIHLLNTDQKFHIDNEMFFVCDYDLNVVAHTHKAVDITKYSSEEILGRNLCTFLKSDIAENFQSVTGNFEGSLYQCQFQEGKRSTPVVKDPIRTELFISPTTSKGDQAAGKVASVPVDIFVFPRKIYFFVLCKKLIRNAAETEHMESIVEALRKVPFAESPSSSMHATNTPTIDNTGNGSHKRNRFVFTQTVTPYTPPAAS